MGDFNAKDALAGIFVIGATVVGGPLAGAAAASSVFGAAATIQSTGAQQVELELAARAEKLQAQDREVQRQTRLTAVLGAQRAAAAASGVAFTGSVANISIQDAEQASIDRLVDRSNTRLTIRSLKNRSRNIGRAGVLSAGASILSTGASIASGVVLKKGRRPSTGNKPAPGSKKPKTGKG